MPLKRHNRIMLNLKQLSPVLFFLLGINFGHSQLGFSHEIGVIAGPLEFRSDFGQRFDERTNFKNSGIGIGIVHYINFSYRADCNCYTTDTYFNDHFKLRNEISWNKTKLWAWQHVSTTQVVMKRLMITKPQRTFTKDLWVDISPTKKC